MTYPGSGMHVAPRCLSGWRDGGREWTVGTGTRGGSFLRTRNDTDAHMGRRPGRRLATGDTDQRRDDLPCHARSDRGRSGVGRKSRNIISTVTSGAERVKNTRETSELHTVHDSGPMAHGGSEDVDAVARWC